MTKHYRHSLISLLLLWSAPIFCQQLVAIENIGFSTKQQLSNIIVGQAQYDVKYYKVQYKTHNTQNQEVIASGLMAVPQSTTCAYFPLLTYCHGTTLRKEDVPSRDNTEAILVKTMAGFGYVACAPDYLGMGDSPGFHPYVHAESEATASIDLMRAVKEYIADSTNYEWNEQVYLTGYSQGGHAAMATHKYIQDNSLLSEFPVTASAPASGPYHMSGPQAKSLIRDKPYSNPGYVVYLLKSYQTAYSNLYTNLTDVLKAPYKSSIPPLFDGAHSMSDVNAVLPNKIEDFLDSTFYYSFKNDSVNQTHPLWQYLKENDNYNWKPEAPVRMYYCTNDEQVFFQNALNAEKAMKNLGATDVKAIKSGEGNHSQCVLPAILAAKAFFDSTSTACNPLQLPHVGQSPTQLIFYPNPSKGELNISLPHKSTLTLYNLNGQEVHQQMVEAGNTHLNVEVLPKGVYSIRIQHKHKTSTIKWLKE